MVRKIETDGEIDEGGSVVSDKVVDGGEVDGRSRRCGEAPSDLRSFLPPNSSPRSSRASVKSQLRG